MHHLSKGLFVSLVFSIVSSQAFSAESQIRRSSYVGTIKARRSPTPQRGEHTVSVSPLPERRKSVAESLKRSAAFLLERENQSFLNYHNRLVTRVNWTFDFLRATRKRYELAWGRTFHAKEAVKLILQRAQALPSVKKVIELDAGYGLNSVYAFAKNQEPREEGRQIQWECFESGFDDIFDRRHPFFIEHSAFKAPEKRLPLEVVSDESRDMKEVLLTFFNPSCLWLTDRVIENGVEKEIVSEVSEETLKLRETLEKFIERGGSYVAVVGPTNFNLDDPSLPKEFYDYLQNSKKFILDTCDKLEDLHFQGKPDQYLMIYKVPGAF